MDKQLSDDDDSKTSILSIFADSSSLADEDIEENEKRQAILKAIKACLDDREGYILIRYYGLDGAQAQTLEQIGKDIGLTRERVRQLKERSLPKLRVYLVKNKLITRF